MSKKRAKVPNEMFEQAMDKPHAQLLSAEQHLRERIWAMRRAGDIENVLKAVHGSLEILEIKYKNCGVNMVDSSGDTPRFSPHSIDSTGKELETPSESSGGEPLATVWQSGEPFYRSDLQREDLYNESRFLDKPYGSGVRSVLDVPFSHGTLAINSDAPEAFSEKDIVALQNLSRVLSEAFRRWDDLRASEQHLASLEREIDRRQQTEEALRQAKEEAEEASRAKSKFLANMSHELRTPLNAIIGYSEMLQEEAEDDNMENFAGDLGKINTAGKHLLTLINDILDLSKIEAGHMELFLETFQIRALVQEVISTVRPLIEKNGNELEVLVEAAIESMRSDQTKIQQNLFNLLSNAAKFTKEGKISLRVQSEVEDQQDWLIFQIQDTGIGMSSAELAGVFEAFRQADASTTRKYGGTGLGLAITQRFCQLLGGSIAAVSEPDQGSIFTMRLPSQAGADSGEEVAAESPLKTIKTSSSEKPTVLVIDDDVAVLYLDRQRLNGYVEKILQKGAYEREDLLAQVRALIRVPAGKA
jgi:signal transduction histidine kinase